MSLHIHTTVFDTWTGAFQSRPRRTNIFAHSSIADVGVQVLPPVGRPFPITTQRFAAPALIRYIALELDGLIGETVDIFVNGNDHRLLYGFRYVVEDLRHQTLDVIPSVCGYRSGSFVEYSPAGRLVTEWRLRAVNA